MKDPSAMYCTLLDLKLVGLSECPNPRLPEHRDRKRWLCPAAVCSRIVEKNTLNPRP